MKERFTSRLVPAPMEVSAVHEGLLSQLLDSAVGRLAAYGYLLTGSTAAGDELVKAGISRAFVRHRRIPSVRAAEHEARAAMRTLHSSAIRRSAPGAAEPVASATAGPVASALALLSPRERAIVVFRYVDQLAIPEIAAVMRTRATTVERTLEQAHATLGGTLGEIAPQEDRIEIVETRRR